MKRHYDILQDHIYIPLFLDLDSVGIVPYFDDIVIYIPLFLDLDIEKQLKKKEEYIIYIPLFLDLDDKAVFNYLLFLQFTFHYF